MPQRKKPISLNTGHHLSKKQKLQQQEAENAIGNGQNLSNIAPSNLNSTSQRIYSYIVDSFGSLGILKPIDTYTVQQLALIITRMGKLDQFIKKNGQILTRQNGSLYVNPACHEKDVLIKQFKSLSIELGMTPSSRSRLASLSDVKASIHQKDQNNDPLLRILNATDSDIKRSMKFEAKQNNAKQHQ